MQWRPSTGIVLATIVAIGGCSPVARLQLKSGAPFNPVYFASTDLYECRKAAGLPPGRESPDVNSLDDLAAIFQKYATVLGCLDARGYALTPATSAQLARESAATQSISPAVAESILRDASGRAVSASDLQDIGIECRLAVGLHAIENPHVRTLPEAAQLLRTMGLWCSCVHSRLGQRGYPFSPEMAREITRRLPALFGEQSR